MRAWLAAVMFLVACAGSSEASEATHWKRCGSQHHVGAGWYHVRAHRVTCENARTVARRYWNNGGPEHVTVDGVTYRCHDEQVGDEVSRVRCRAPAERRVRFEVGA